MCVFLGGRRKRQHQRFLFFVFFHPRKDEQVGVSLAVKRIQGQEEEEEEKFGAKLSAGSEGGDASSRQKRNRPTQLGTPITRATPSAIRNLSLTVNRLFFSTLFLFFRVQHLKNGKMK